MVTPWVEQVAALGAPAERLLARCGISPELLEHPDAVVPLERALRWTRLVCRALGSQHVGLYLGCETALERLGAYGRRLSGARTLQQYLRLGVSLYDTVVAGQRFWLSSHGERVRLNLGAPWEPTLGDYQAHLHAVAITILAIRRFAGATWVPEEISFGFRPREAMPALDVIGDARIVHRPGPSYIELARSMLGQQRVCPRQPSAQGDALRPLPQDLAGLVELQIESWLPQGVPPVALVAESLGRSARSLQRGLAAAGVSYAELRDEVRMRHAAEWLTGTDKPIIDIALDLGYGDASNFTRAFRRRTGVPPRVFRSDTRSEATAREAGSE